MVEDPASRSRYRWFLFPLMILVLLPLGCKAGDTIAGGISPATAGFVEEERPPSVTERYVSLRTGSSDGGQIVLDVVVTEVDEPVIGIAIKLSYPPSFSKFSGCSDGDLLPSGTCLFAEPESGSGEVFISRSVIGDDSVTVNGDQVIVRIEFLVFGPGEGEIVIEGQNLGGGDTSALLDINNDPIFVQWYSGVLTGE